MSSSRTTTTAFALALAMLAGFACRHSQGPKVVMGPGHAPPGRAQSTEPAVAATPTAATQGPDTTVDVRGLDVATIDVGDVDLTATPADLAELTAQLADVFFTTDSALLDEASRASIEANATLLMNHPSAHLLIEGHCDERNTMDYNYALGANRAQATKQYLVALGIDPGRLHTISWGEMRPIAEGHDEAAWRLNRRAHLVATAPQPD